MSLWGFMGRAPVPAGGGEEAFVAAGGVAAAEEAVVEPSESVCGPWALAVEEPVGEVVVPWFVMPLELVDWLTDPDGLFALTLSRRSSL